MTGEKQKEDLLKHILNERKHFESILIFSSTKSKISDIVRSLKRQGFPAHGISSDFEQSEREEILRNFRSKKIRILVATDVMSRGIDIKDINLIINYDVSRNQEDYVHRVGRTARVNSVGEAITLVSPKDMTSLRKIEKLIGRSIPVIPVPGEFSQEAHTMTTGHSSGEKRPKTGSKTNRAWRKRRVRE